MTRLPVGVSWHCALCGDEITGPPYWALVDHLRLHHPATELPARWPDGDLVIDTFTQLEEATS